MKFRLYFKMDNSLDGLGNGIDFIGLSENVSMPLPQFVLFMGMFGGIILTNANFKAFLLIYKTNYPTSKISLLLSKTKRQNSR